MKKWLVMIGLLTLFIGISVVKSDAITVQSVIGSSVNCDVNNTGCVAQYFRNGTILCTGATCPTRFSADLSDSTKFVGVGVGGCRQSIDSGFTWTLCAAQPLGGGVLNGIGVTTNGTWISASQSGGSCLVGRSINRGVSWSTVSTLVAGCTDLSAGRMTLVRCAVLVCDIAVDDTNMGVWTSTDDGVTWGYGFTSTRTGGARGFVFNGTKGMYVGQTAGTTMFTTSGNGGWTLGALALNPGGTCYYGIIDSVLGPVMYCGGRTPKQLVNITTSVVTNIILVNGVLNNFEQVVQSGTNIYVFGTSANPSCVGNVASLWVSINNGTTFTELQCLSAVTFDGGDYALVGSNLYFSVGGSQFIRFSY